VGDKLNVVHPDSDWTVGGTPSAIRTNFLKNPRFETNASSWNPVGTTALTRTTASSRSGVAAASVFSSETETNLVRMPLHSVSTTGITGWAAGMYADISAVGDWLRTYRVGLTMQNTWLYTYVPRAHGVTPGQSYRFSVE